MFGIPVDDKDKDKDDTTESVDANTNSGPGDVHAELLANAAYDVDDAHDDELVHVYDKENPVIEVGKLWPNMDNFRMCFKTYAVKHEFEAKTMWTNRKKIMLGAKVMMEAPTLANGTYLLDDNLMAIQSG